MSFIKDLVILDVVMVIGSMKVKVIDKEYCSIYDVKLKSVIDFDELFIRIEGEVDGKVKLFIVVVIWINIDKDIYNFVVNDLGEVGKELVELYFKFVDMVFKVWVEIVVRLLFKFGRKELGNFQFMFEDFLKVFKFKQYCDQIFQEDVGGKFFLEELERLVEWDMVNIYRILVSFILLGNSFIISDK